MNITFKTGAAATMWIVLTALPAAADVPIQDNSFLVEEAYNQEPGVIQHIQTLVMNVRGAGWRYSFTEEWPVLGQTHQASVTLNAAGAPAALGDVLLNYRLQLVNGKVAVAPRLSAILPAGAGTAGVETNLPASVDLTVVVVHLNAGVTWHPAEEAAAWFAGASVVWLARHDLNVMIETWGSTGAEDRLLVSPGLRAAIDVADLQVVPGLAAPIGIGPSAGEVSLLAYLSFEHPAW